MKNLKQRLFAIPFVLLLGLNVSVSASPGSVDAAAATENNTKKPPPASKILPLLHEQDPELVFNMLHVQHISRSFEQPSPTSSAQRRLGKSSKPKRKREPKSTKKSELSFLEAVTSERDTCAAKLEELKLKDSLPRYMFVQQADDCRLRREEDGQIVLESAHFLSDTERFSDRPMTYESTIPTSEWFDHEFNDMFGGSNEGWPNTAMSMVNDDKSTGTVVSVYSFAYSDINEEGNTVYGYKVKQSDEQADVKSLEDLLGGANEVVIDHCALFIDSADVPDCGWNCEPPGTYADDDEIGRNGHTSSFWCDPHYGGDLNSNPKFARRWTKLTCVSDTYHRCCDGFTCQHLHWYDTKFCIATGSDGKPKATKGGDGNYYFAMADRTQWQCKCDQFSTECGCRWCNYKDDTDPSNHFDPNKKNPTEGMYCTEKDRNHLEH